MGYTAGGAFLCIAVFFGVYVWVALQGVVEWITRPSRQPAAFASSRPELSEKTACKYHAHALDGSIIGTFDAVLDAEVCGLTAAGVKPVDLPLVLHERRRLGTYGRMYGEERKSQPRSQPWWYPIEYQCATCGLRSTSVGICGRCNASNAFPIY
jgi:hypothetical protein